MCLSFIWAIRRNVGSLVIAGAATLFLAALFVQEPVPALVFVWAVAIVTGAVNPRAATAFALAGGVLIGIEVLAKLSTGVAVLAFGALAIAAAPAGRRRLALLFGSALAVTTAVGWLLTGQSVEAIPAFAGGSLDLISGYSEAMLSDTPGRQWEFWLAPILILLGFLAAHRAAEGLGRRAHFGLLALWAVMAWTAFKAGFVRHDPGHVNVFLTSILGGLLAFRVPTHWRPAGAITILLVVVATCASLPVEPGDIVHPRMRARALIDQARLLANGGRTGERIAAARALLANGYAFDPQLLAHVEHRRVHVDPSEAGLAWVFDLPWQPLPTFQAYLAYTDRSDELNADATARPTGPERIVRQSEQPLDGRNPAFDSPAAVRAMFCHYRPVRTTERWQILARAADRCGRPRRLTAVRARFGTHVPIPAASGQEAVYAEFDDVQVHGLEKIRTSVYRAWFRAIYLDTRGYRLVPGTAGNGLMLRVPANADFPAPFNLDQKASTLTVARGLGEQPDDEFGVRFFALPLR